jgi:hypothetical protein
MRVLAVLIVVAVAAIALAVASRGDSDGDDRPAASERQQQPQQQTPTPTPQASIEPQGISEHLQALAQAAKPDNTRAAGTPGDRKTAHYIAQRLRAAGYRVTEQAFKVPLFREREPARVSGLRRGRDFLTLTFSGSGRATGATRRIGLACDPVTALGQAKIAIARRGICTFSEKTRHAQAAGAKALLIVSDGAPFTGSLIGPVRIPVLAVSAKAGRALSHQVSLRVDAVSGRRITRNVLAEKAPPPDRVVMVGAHLDSVVPGPGINDNGSGVAATLEVAEQLAGEDVPVRFGFWAAEEIGLVGSRRYVNSLSRVQKRRIRAYINLDMVGSPHERIAVYEGEDAAQRRIEQALRAELPDNAPEEDLGGASDHASFDNAGIPVGGLFTGLDRCYHRPCDRLNNADPVLAAAAARATAAAARELASGG